MSGWQPIDTAPRDETLVLGYFPDLEAGYHSTRWLSRMGLWASRAYPAQPTHWQPLPEPPA